MRVNKIQLSHAFACLCPPHAAAVESASTEIKSTRLIRIRNARQLTRGGRHITAWLDYSWPPRVEAKAKAVKRDDTSTKNAQQQKEELNQIELIKLLHYFIPSHFLHHA